MYENDVITLFILCVYIKCPEMTHDLDSLTVITEKMVNNKYLSVMEAQYMSS